VVKRGRTDVTKREKCVGGANRKKVQIPFTGAGQKQLNPSDWAHGRPDSLRRLSSARESMALVLNLPVPRREASMSRKDPDLERLIDSIAEQDCDSEEDVAMRLCYAIQEQVKFPLDGRVIGEPVKVLKVEESNGLDLLAVCERNGKRYRVRLQGRAGGSLHWSPVDRGLSPVPGPGRLTADRARSIRRRRRWLRRARAIARGPETSGCTHDGQRSR
jgi:hypothetical protein